MTTLFFVIWAVFAIPLAIVGLILKLIFRDLPNVILFSFVWLPPTLMIATVVAVSIVPISIMVAGLVFSALNGVIL